jgi:hypothetical protein
MRHWNASSSRARSSHSTPPHRGQVYPLGIAFGSPAALGSLVWLNTSLAIVYLLPPRPQYRSHGTHVGRLHAFGARSEAAVYRAALLSQTFVESPDSAPSTVRRSTKQPVRDSRATWF